MWASQQKWLRPGSSVLVPSACCSLMPQRDCLIALKLQRGSAEGCAIQHQDNQYVTNWQSVNLEL